VVTLISIGNILQLLYPNRQLSKSIRTSSPNGRKFIELPESATLNDASDLITTSVIAWSFYPKLLSREGNGWQNVATHQHVTLHPTSVNKATPDPPRYLSFYSIMQSSSKFYNALETSGVEDLAIALGCGDAEFKTYAGTLAIDGNRIRFALGSWSNVLMLKAMRLRLKEIIAQALRSPGRNLSPDQQFWFDTWREVFGRHGAGGKR
jgi:ATP-dependent RNA helicase DHX29